MESVVKITGEIEKNVKSWYLLYVFPYLPESMRRYQFNKWCREGRVKLNGVIIRKNQLIKNGDNLYLDFSDEFDKKVSMEILDTLTNQRG